MWKIYLFKKLGLKIKISKNKNNYESYYVIIIAILVQLIKM